MKIQVGKTYRSDVAEQTLPGGKGPKYEKWRIVANAHDDYFVGVCIRSGNQRLYRVFDSEGLCIDAGCVGATRQLAPITVKKKKGWIARGVTLNFDGGRVANVGMYAYATKEAAADAYPNAAAYHEIEWEEEEET